MVLRGTPTNILRALFSPLGGALTNNSQAYAFRPCALASLPWETKHVAAALLLYLAATTDDCAIAEVVIHTAPAAYLRTA